MRDRGHHTDAFKNRNKTTYFQDNINTGGNTKSGL